jgi:carbamoyltransferase
MYKHIGCISPTQGRYFVNAPGEMFGDEDGHEFELLVTDRAGIVKTYEAATYYCGWNFIEAGKTMGLSPYGEESEEFDDLFDNESGLSNRNLVVPTYPMGAHINFGLNTYLNNHWYKEDLTELENRRNIAYAVQKGSQKAVLNLIRKAVTMSGNKNVVLSGGYGLNCVANYYYLEELKDEGINLYVEPISSDAGTAMGAALLIWHDLDNSSKINYSADGLYLGFKYDYSDKEITSLAEKYNATISSTSYNEIVDIITNKNIVAMFQGSAESGPRALGNRSILYDPTDPNGKDHVNKVKRREYFRPFAGTILAEDVHDWFDLRGMKDSPYMMYAVNCQPGVEEKIPSIIHVDGTCRIQTVTEEQNYHYYNLIKSFKEKTDCPIIFNTSFNLGGEPLVEDLDDALRTLANSDIEYLFLPEYNKLITIKN